MDNNGPNNAVDRRTFIVEYLEKHGETRIDQLSELFKVSEITLRRDLEILESQGRIRRVRGGAAPALANPLEEMFHEKLSLNTREKREIARKAASLVQDNQVVILSAGTTTTYIARELTKKQNLTIVTSAINIAAEIAPYSHITLVMIGGIIRTGSYAAVGHLADDALDNINGDIAFVGVDGIDIESGFTTPNFMEARTDNMILKSATSGYIVADDSKFGKVKMARVARLDEPSGLIVNRSAPEDFIYELETRNCHVIRD